jgi:hypothetical protein
MTKAPRYWHSSGPITCDICNASIVDQFTDGKTRRGPWAIMCNTCLPKHGSGLWQHHGDGLGQQYTKQADGKWLKTA